MKPVMMSFMIPLLLLLLVLEWVYSFKEHRPVYKSRDTFCNIVVGIGFVVINGFSKWITFYVYQFMYQFHLLHISGTWMQWTVTIVAADLSYYVYHRVSHEVNWFWASHAVHHSSEEYNISVTFRLPWITTFAGHFIFWLWMPLLGFPPLMVMIASQVIVLYQGILHTKLIGKLHPLIEYIFNTPSHHRVHHSSNLEYLDKNHGGMLIIWDRLFNTFREEEREAVYGLTKKIHKDDPLNIVFFGWKEMLGHVAKAGSIRNAINYLVQPPGWSHDGSSKTVKQLRELQS